MSKRVPFLFLSLLVATSVSHAQKFGWDPPTHNTHIYYEDSIPHIFSETDYGAFYALGYQQVRDFPTATLLGLWASSGRMAEVAGFNAADRDFLIRHWRVGEIADHHEANLSAENKCLLEAYVAGVNAARSWWKNRPGQRALLLDEITSGKTGATMHVDPAAYVFNDSLVFGDHDAGWTASLALTRLFGEPIDLKTVLMHGIVVDSGVGPGGLFAGGFEEVPPGPSLKITDFGSRSNGWLMKDGSTIVTHSDGHVPLKRFGIRYYFVQMEGEDYQVSGVTLPGFPAIFVGYNDDLSWWVTGPDQNPLGVDREMENGFIGNRPVLYSEWDADPITANGEEFEFPLSTMSGPELQCVKKETVTLEFWDWSLNDYGTANKPTRDLWYVEDHDDGPDLLVVSPSPGQSPVDGGAIRFAQSVFALQDDTSHSPWEMLIGLGKASEVTDTAPGTGVDVEGVLSQSMLTFGAQNLAVADSSGTFGYWFLSRIPEQGPDATADAAVGALWANDDTTDDVLDGEDVDYRWTGKVHDAFAEDATEPDPVPQLIDDDSVAEKLFVNNNSSPAFTPVVSNHTLDVTGLPSYMVETTSNPVGRQGMGTRRQRQAEDLFDALSGSPTLATNQTYARDHQDTWFVDMWSYFSEIAGNASNFAPADQALVATLESFIDSNRNESGTEFLADEFSRVTVWTSLLRSHYTHELLEHASTTPSNLSLGFDAYLMSEGSPPSETDVQNGGTWMPNKDAMVEAWSIVANLHDATVLEREDGLMNRTWLMGDNFDSDFDDVNARLTAVVAVNDTPWSDASYASDLRWGHVNMLCLTAHFLPAQGAEGQTQSQQEALWRSSFYSGVLPGDLGCSSLIAEPPFPTGWSEEFDKPFRSAQRSAVWPVGGVADSVFSVGALQDEYRLAVRPTGLGIMNEPDYFYFMPFTVGSQTMLTVDLSGSGSEGYFLSVMGATEITTNANEISEDDHYATTEDFLSGNWTRLDELESNLGTARYDLFYDPICAQ